MPLNSQDNLSLNKPTKEALDHSLSMPDSKLRIPKKESTDNTNLAVKATITGSSRTIENANNSVPSEQNQNYPQQNYPQQNYPQQNYPQQNYPQQNYPQQNYPQQNYPQQNYPQQNYPQQNYPQQNYPQQNYPQQLMQPTVVINNTNTNTAMAKAKSSVKKVRTGELNRPINHMLHFILTLITGGLWGIVWIWLAVRR